jgi:hypothetical protein
MVGCHRLIAMSYYCERDHEKGASGKLTYANGETESLCRDCINEHVSNVVLTSIQNGVVRSAQGAKELKHDTLERFCG